MESSGCKQGEWEPGAAKRGSSSWGSLSLAALLQTNTNYSQEKHRCEYLHSKLAHIKRLIAEYDQRQLQAWP